MDFYHTKKQTENIPRSYSYLLLKTLFYFISQCCSVPYLQSGLFKLDEEQETSILHLFRQGTDLLMKVIIKCVNINLWDILGCFHYILNTPRRPIPEPFKYLQKLPYPFKFLANIPVSLKTLKIPSYHRLYENVSKFQKIF